MRDEDSEVLSQDSSTEELSRFLGEFRQALLLRRKTQLNLILRFQFPDLGAPLYEGLDSPDGLDFRKWLPEPPPESIVRHKIYRKLIIEQENLMRRAAEILEASQQGILQARQFAVFLHLIYVFDQTSFRLLFTLASSIADTDELTGLLNRTAMERDLARELKHIQRSDSVFTLAMLDADHFKRINDEHGHAFGDRVLETFADCFIDSIRPRDQVYRYGGEEFLLLLPDTPMKNSVHVLERLRRRVQNLVIDGIQTQTSVSLGATEVTKDSDIKEAIKRADKALYQAKEAGRNRLELA